MFKTLFGAIDTTNQLNRGAEKSKQKARKTTIAKTEPIYHK